MANFGSYFVKEPRKLIPQSKCIIKGQSYRFSILTPRLIRIEYNSKGIFEDRATSLVVNRTFPDVNFNASVNEQALIITTEYFTLTYVKESPLNANTIKMVINGTTKEWSPGYKDVRNLGGISYSLDNLDNKLKLDKGLYSLDGFVVIENQLLICIYLHIKLI